MPHAPALDELVLSRSRGAVYHGMIYRRYFSQVIRWGCVIKMPSGPNRKQVGEQDGQLRHADQVRRLRRFTGLLDSSFRLRGFSSFSYR